MSEEDQKEVMSLLEKPDVKAALSCPEVREIIELAREEPQEANRLVHLKQFKYSQTLAIQTSFGGGQATRV